jgi:hypothetical protein
MLTTERIMNKICHKERAILNLTEFKALMFKIIQEYIEKIQT